MPCPYRFQYYSPTNFVRVIAIVFFHFMTSCSLVFFIHDCKFLGRTYFLSLRVWPWIMASMPLRNKVFHPQYYTCYSRQVYSIVRVCSARPSLLFVRILSSFLFPFFTLTLNTVTTNVTQNTPWQENNKFTQPCGLLTTCYMMSNFYLRFTTGVKENKRTHLHKLCIYVTEISVDAFWRLDPSGIEFSWSAEIYIHSVKPATIAVKSNRK
jgi:hypothetical protein